MYIYLSIESGECNRRDEEDDRNDDEFSLADSSVAPSIISVMSLAEPEITEGSIQ